MAFLDVEHYLGLRKGRTTWSTDGNEGQVVVKTLIGEILNGSGLRHGTKSPNSI